MHSHQASSFGPILILAFINVSSCYSLSGTWPQRCSFLHHHQYNILVTTALGHRNCRIPKGIRRINISFIGEKELYKVFIAQFASIHQRCSLVAILRFNIGTEFNQALSNLKRFRFYSIDQGCFLIFINWINICSSAY